MAWRLVDGQVVILDLRDSIYLRTNAVGTLLWDRLQVECTLDDLTGMLVERFGIGRETAVADCRRFLTELAEHGLLEGTVPSG